MKRTLPAVALAAILVSCGGEKDGAVHPGVASAVEKTRDAHPDLFKRKVVLLGFDSCDPDLVEKYVREGKLPNFARLIREGAHGALSTVQPILSPVVWTTIATGMTPQRHGILDFYRLENGALIPFDSRQRQADTVWELLSGQGETVGVVGWLCTWPAEKVNGFIATERMGQLAFEQFGGESVDTTKGRTWPESLASELADDQVDAKEQPYSSIRPFLDITEKEYTDSYEPKFTPKNLVANLRLTLATAETFRNVGERLHAERQPRFFACYFEAMDAISHFFMPYAPPKERGIDTALYMKYRTAIEANYIWHDQVLGEFLDQCDADTTVFVVSDHGFKNGDFRMADSSDFMAKTGAMWHRQYGVFYAWGNGVKSGARVDGASVYDITPTILASMGYPLSGEMPGKVIQGAFESPLPEERVETYYGETRRDRVAADRANRESEGEATKALSPEQEESMERLKSLGYSAGDQTVPISAKLNEATALMGQNQFEKAYQLLKVELAKPGHRVPMLLCAQSWCCIRTGRLDEADELVAESTAKDPQDPQGMLMRTNALLAHKKFAEAEKSARATLLFKNDSERYHQALASALEGQKGEAEARKDEAEVARLRQAIIEVYETALRYEPRQWSLLIAIARTRLESRARTPEDCAKARDELDRTLEIFPSSPTALNNRAIALLALGMNAEAAGQTVEGDRLMQEALVSVEKACALAEDGRYGPQYKGYAQGWANKAYVLWQMNRLADAAVAAQRVRAIDPAYVLHPGLLKALQSAGHTLAVIPPK